MSAPQDAEHSSAQYEAARRRIRGRSVLTLGALAAALIYLASAWFSLDIAGILDRSEPGRAGVLLKDAVAFKTRVLRDLRRGGWEVMIENDSRSTYEENPEWTGIDGDTARIDLGDGVVAFVSDQEVSFNWPGYGDVVAKIDGRKLSVDLPERVFTEEPQYEERLIQARIASTLAGKKRAADREFEKSLEDSDWFSASAARAGRWMSGLIAPPAELTAEETKSIRDRFEQRVTSHNVSFDGRTLDVRLSWDKRIWIIAGTKIEVHRFEYGWENFWFDFDSPLKDKSFSELLASTYSGERFDPAQSNASYIFESFWLNKEWRHGYVANAVFETLLMAFVGTFFASFFALPLAFLASKNFTPFRTPLSLGFLTAFAPVRFVTRRLFDFLRGIDMLIWSLIFIRAFGLGPLTGALAITFTDTGTLGKLFSEALENVDNKQIEGVKATGAAQLQRYRFGVIPQIMPVFISQSLYYFESNIRSATVIGALGAGGIGLVLKETINTKSDWENVFLLIILTVLLVIIVDTISGWLRRRLIQGGARRASMVGVVFAGLAGSATATLFGLEFFEADWLLFSLAFSVLFIGLMVWTLWLVAAAPRDPGGMGSAATGRA